MNKKRIRKNVEILLIILCIASLGFLMMQVNEKSQEDKNSISEMSSGWFYFNDGEKIEVELLNQWGIDMIQGYYFSRPVCEEEILKLIVG